MERRRDLHAELRDGAIDAVVDDSPIAGYFSQLVPGLRVSGVLPGSDAVYAIMIRKGNDGWRYALDDTVIEIERDGTLQAIHERWLDMDALRKKGHR